MTEADAPDVKSPVGTHAGAHLPLAVLTLLAGAALAAGASASTIGAVAAVATLQALLVGSWVYGSNLPGRKGALVLGVAAAAASDVLVVRYHLDGYGPLLGVLGLAIPLMFVHQLTRGIGRARVMESLSDITIMVIAIIAVSGLAILRYQTNGSRLSAALALSVAVAIAVDHVTDMILPVMRFDERIDRGLPGVVLGVLAGAAVGLLMLRSLFDFAAGRGAFVGAAIGAVGCLLSIGTSFSGLHSTLAWAPSVDTDVLVASRLRLRSVAAALLALFLSVPAGYVLVGALTR